MISIHQRMSRGVSVSHTSHSITTNTLLLPNLAKNHQPRHSPWLIQVHQLRPSFMLKNTPTKDLLFRLCWPFSPLPSLTSLGDVFRPLPSDHLDKNMRREKRTGNMIVKTRKWNHKNFVFGEKSNQRSQKSVRKIGKRTKGCSNCQEGLHSRTQSSTRVNLEISFFSFKGDFVLKKIRMIIFEHILFWINLCSLLQKKFKRQLFKNLQIYRKSFFWEAFLFRKFRKRWKTTEKQNRKRRKR